MLAVDWAPWIAGVAAVLAVSITLVVVAAPWRGVREESQLDEEVATRLLLGEDPEELDKELEGREEPTAPVSDLRPDD